MSGKLQWKASGNQTWHAQTDHGRYVWWEFDEGDQYIMLPGDYSGRKVLDAKARAEADYAIRSQLPVPHA